MNRERLIEGIPNLRFVLLLDPDQHARSAGSRVSSASCSGVVIRTEKIASAMPAMGKATSAWTPNRNAADPPIGD